MIESEEEDVIAVQTTDLINAVYQAYVRGYIDSTVHHKRDHPEDFSLLSNDANVERDENDPAGLWIDAFGNLLGTIVRRPDGSTPIPEMADLIDIVASKLKAINQTTDSAP